MSLLKAFLFVGLIAAGSAQVYADDNWFALDGELSGAYVNQAQMLSKGLRVVNVRFGTVREAQATANEPSARALIFTVRLEKDMRFNELYWITQAFTKAYFQKEEFGTRITVKTDIVWWSQIQDFNDSAYNVMRKGEGTRFYLFFNEEASQQFREQRPTMITFGN